MNDSTIFVVDDEEISRTLLAEMLETIGYRVEGYGSAEAFLDAWRPDKQGCLILDMYLPGMTGEDLQSVMQARGISLPIVFVSGQGDIPTTVRAMRGGAVDFLTKPVDLATLRHAIESALERGRAQRRELVERQTSIALLERLSPRERQVLDLALSGMHNKEIARQLGLSHRTVEVHRSRIFLKLGVGSLIDAMRLVAMAGSVEATSPHPEQTYGTG